MMKYVKIDIKIETKCKKYGQFYFFVSKRFKWYYYQIQNVIAHYFSDANAVSYKHKTDIVNKITDTLD